MKGAEGPQGAAAGGEVPQDPAPGPRMPVNTIASPTAGGRGMMRSKSGSDSEPMTEENRVVKGRTYGRQAE